jgi:uncharacterized protein YciI
MFIVILRFTDKKDQAARWMDGHNDWLRRGFDAGVFLLAGSLQPRTGGAVVAAGASRAEIEARVNADPFVAQGIVTAEIVEVAPSRADPRLGFLA